MQRILSVFHILILLFLSSCSSDEKEYKNAVSVFQSSSGLEIDKSLEKKSIKIPKQKHNKFWFGSNKASNNFNIENFSFTSEISKTTSIWSGYRTGNNDKKVFRPLIVGDIIYLLDAKGNLISRDLYDYKVIWKKRIFDKIDRSNFQNGKIYFDDGKIFATSGYNYLVAVTAKDGNRIWSKKLGSIPVSAPIVAKGKVFVTTADNKTYALDVKDGSIKWIHSGIDKNTAILGAADPVIYKNYVLSSYSSGEIYILDRKNGSVGWTYDLNVNRAINSDFILNDIDSTPIVKNDVVYVVGNGGLMMAIAAKDGNVLWRKELSSISDFWIAGDFIYLVNNDNQIICLYKKTGGVKWHQDLDKDKKDEKKKTIYNGIIMAGDNLILSNSQSEILVISPHDGEILQKKRISKKIYHTPIIAGKKLYLHSVGRFTVDLIVME